MAKISNVFSKEEVKRLLIQKNYKVDSLYKTYKK